MKRILFQDVLINHAFRNEPGGPQYVKVAKDAARTLVPDGWTDKYVPQEPVYTN